MADEVKAAQSATKDAGPTLFDKIIDKSIPAGKICHTWTVDVIKCVCFPDSRHNFRG
jgi:hypothetical protein